MGTKQLWIFLALIFVVVASLSFPFVMNFWESELSNQINDWGAFGSYFSIVIASVNLIVFIYLTIYISRMDEQRHQSQLNSQHKVAISQFRQTEISALSARLNNLFANYGTESKPQILGNLTTTSVYLNNFFNEKSFLFPILNEERLKIHNTNFQSRCSQLIDIVDEHHGKELSMEYQKKLETKVQAVLTTQNLIIEELQKFMLVDLKAKSD